MALFYNQADQDIYNKGIKFLPQEKYRMGPYTPTVNEDVEKIQTNFGIPYTNAFTGGGDNFSVYNADPNTITNRNPNKYALQDARYANELSYVGSPTTGYTTDTEAIKNMENYPEYYGLDAAARKDKEPTKYQELISKGIDFLPGIGPLKRGAEFLSNVIGPYMPINRRAIMENQAGIDGVKINNIGQIVLGQGQAYNTPEGIMAGYNYNQMTDETFTGRQKNIGETLKEKYDLTQEQVDGLISGKYTEEDFEDERYNIKGTDKQTNLITNLINIEKARKNFGNATGTTDKIIDFKTDTKTNKRNDGADTTASDDNNQNVQNIASANEQNYQSAAYDSPAPNYTAADDRRESYRGRKDGGRAGYFFGGRVNFKNGGLASIL